jgi:hypothetical protein
MTSEQISEKSDINRKFYKVITALIVGLMMACQGITVVLFVRKVSLNLKLYFLPVLGFLIALERVTSSKSSSRLLTFTRKWIFLHLSRWVFILFLLKIILLISNPPGSILFEFQLWRLDFFTYFTDTRYIFSVVFLILIWMISGFFANLLEEMSIEESLIRLEMGTMAPISTIPVRDRLLGLIFGLGFAQLALTALLRIDLRMLISGEFDSLGVQPLPFLAAGAWNALAYFILGLVLMSLSQFTRLNARWRFQKIEISQRLGVHWATYSILFIVFLAILASVLPTNYSLGFLSTLGYLLKYVFGFLLFIFGFVWSLLIYAFNLLLTLFGLTPQSQVSLPEGNFTPPEQPVDIPQTAVYPWLEVVKSLLFWAIFLGVIGFSVYQFIRQHEGILTAIRKTPGVSWLSRFFAWLLGSFKGFNQRLSHAIDIGLGKLRSQTGIQVLSDLPRFRSLRHLSPRQRVYFFFLAMIRRGGERGIPREDSQTPYEYASNLEENIPNVDHDVTSLTSAFVEARYSQHNVDQVKAGLVKRHWERIRSALRSFRK